MSQPERTDPPEDFEIGWEPHADPPGEFRRPDWLVDRDAEVDAPETADARPVGLQMTLGSWPSSRAAAAPSPEAPVPSLEAAAPSPEAPVPWAAAASSVPKLSVVPRRDRPDATGQGLPDASAGSALPCEEGPASGESIAELATADPEDGSQASVTPFHEPWWLVWGEALAGNRLLQVGLAALLVIVATVAMWPKHGEKMTTLSLIRRDPERFEGRLVRVRGEVGEVFEVGRGWVFPLRDGGDTVVVFSSLRQPRTRDRISVVATVSTGYLDGAPRVALFEADPARRGQGEDPLPE